MWLFGMIINIQYFLKEKSFMEFERNVLGMQCSSSKAIPLKIFILESI